jgi:hypothetical protein
MASNVVFAHRVSSYLLMAYSLKTIVPLANKFVTGSNATIMYVGAQDINP